MRYELVDNYKRRGNTVWLTYNIYFDEVLWNGKEFYSYTVVWTQVIRKFHGIGYGWGFSEFKVHEDYPIPDGLLLDTEHMRRLFHKSDLIKRVNKSMLEAKFKKDPSGWCL